MRHSSEMENPFLYEPLRAMHRLLRVIHENSGSLMLGIERWLRARQVNPSEIGGQASGMIGWMSEGLALTFIIRTAQAVGLSKLVKTYDEIVAKGLGGIYGNGNRPVMEILG